ncbi:MAG: hypothetical protein IJA69_03960, partial [Clostridia bacterium]|nr:hypothetical protein [Clostridia bacterium]
EKVVLFVLDIMSIYTILDLYFTSKGHGVAISHTLDTIQTIKNLIGGSRVCENGSISIVANYNPDEKEKFAKEVNDIRKLVVCQLN